VTGAATLEAVKTVVVADDTAFVRDRFRAALAQAGHETLTVRNGAELLGLMRRTGERVDLIALDLRLPQGQGVQMVRDLHKLSNHKPTIVVFSGTIANASEVRELTTLGVAGYVNEYTAVQHILPSLSPHLYPDLYNRRSSPRVTLGIPVAYRVGNTISSAVTLNVSQGGLAIRTTSPLDVGTKLRVRFRLSTSRFDLESEACVAWSVPRLGMGVEFVSLEHESQAAIHAFVHAHFFSNRKA
jgi:uncharacterized protein (TIGR02266 family)